MDYFRVLHRSIRDLVDRFHDHPFDFLYERDLQGFLFSLLLTEFKGETIPMKGVCHRAAEYGESETIQTVPVKSEYSGFDIAIIDPQTVLSFDQAKLLMPKLNNDPFWQQPLLAAVELKYLQIGDRPHVRRNGVQADLKKLQRYYACRKRMNRTFLGISLLFIQSAERDEAAFVSASDRERELGDDPKNGLAKYVVLHRDWHRFAVPVDNPADLRPEVTDCRRWWALGAAS